MRDRLLIGGGILVFLVLAALPVWYNAASRVSPKRPELAMPIGQRCVAPRDQIRREHMTLLVDWRERVVRRHERTFLTADGTTVEMSLTRTCLRCHGGKGDFCDRCHEYAGVRTACFDCHVDRERPGAPPRERLTALRSADIRDTR
jgi:hypothetical protein